MTGRHGQRRGLARRGGLVFYKPAVGSGFKILLSNHFHVLPVLLVIHLMIAAALVCVVLLQKSEGGALGIGGGGGGGFLTGRGTANLLTRATAALAAAFFLTSILLTLIANHSARQGSVFDAGPAGAPV